MYNSYLIAIISTSIAVVILATTIKNHKRGYCYGRYRTKYTKEKKPFNFWMTVGSMYALSVTMLPTLCVWLVHVLLF